MQKLKWEFIGLSPNGGKEYRKNDDLMIIYKSGLKKLFRNFGFDVYKMADEFLCRSAFGKLLPDNF